VEEDISVPGHLKEKFSGMPPIFQNIEISCHDIRGYTESERIIKIMAHILFTGAPLTWYLENRS